MSGRPLDVLEAALEEVVTVHLKDGTAYRGRLGGYDQHMNVVLDPDPDADPDTGDPSPPEEAAVEATPSRAVEDTTIIRGDNVITITT